MQRNNQPQKSKMNSKYTLFSLIIIVLAGLVAQVATKNKDNQINEPSPITTEAPVTVPDVTEIEIAQNGETEEKTEQTVESTTQSQNDKVYKFRKTSYLNQHFEKHKNEFDESFGYTTAEAYEAGASRVVNNPNALHKLEGEDGDDIYYLEETNEFVIVSTDGYLRTYFRPSAGIEYYNRQ